METVKINKKEISRLLADGKEEKARIRVEQVYSYAVPIRIKCSISHDTVRRDSDNGDHKFESWNIK